MSDRQWRNRARVLLLVTSTTWLGTGCGVAHLFSPPSKPATVGMKIADVNLTFGTPPVKTPPHTPPVLPPVPPTLTQLLTPPIAPPPEQPAPQFPMTAPPPACPPPGPNTGAERAIADDVTARIAAGAYRFEQSGTIDVAGLAKVKVDSETVRTVRDVVANSDGSYDFVEDETVGLLHHQVLGFHVVPGRGVYLASLVVTYKGSTNSFHPVLPVEVFPLPATPQVPSVPTQPEQPVRFADVGVDPVNGATMVSQGTVSLNPQRVNGCGEAADGWNVEATWSFQFGQTAQPFQLSYTVAPQYGGFIIADRVQTTDTFGPSVISVDVSSRFGSLHPRKVKSHS